MEQPNIIYTGVVKQPNQKRGGTTNFKAFILETNTAQTIIIEHSYFLWLKKGDKMVARCSSLAPVGAKEIKARLVERPAVILPTDEQALSDAIRDVFKKLDWNEIKSLINSLELRDHPERIPVIFATLDTASCAPLRQDSSALLHHLFSQFNDKEIRQVLNWWKRNRVDRNLSLLGIDYKQLELTDMPHDKIYQQAMRNPYRLYFIPITIADEIINTYQIAFVPGANSVPGNTPDTIAKVEKKQGNNWQDERMYGNIGRKVADFFYRDKHACITEELVNRTISQYNYFAPYLEFVNHEGCVYLEDRLKVQQYALKLLNRKLAEPGLGIKYSPSCKQEGKRSFSQDQIDAINLALNNPVSAITGGAGTGKTTVIRVMVEQLVKYHKKCILTSLTGRAVARMRTLGMHLIGAKKKTKLLSQEQEEAKLEEELKKSAISSLSSFSSGSRGDPSFSSGSRGDPSFFKKEGKEGKDEKEEKKKQKELADPVIVSTMHLMLTKKDRLSEISYIITDEASMVTTPLFVEFISYVIKTLKYCPYLVFVGDQNQLEPIGWGSLYQQIMLCTKIPRAVLQTNHRSCKSILNNANAILNKVAYAPSIDVVDGKLTGFTIVAKDPLGVYYNLLSPTSANAEESTFTGEPEALIEKYQQIRIITGYRDEVEKLNLAIQETRFSSLSASGKGAICGISEINRIKKKWYLGDLVVMKKNSYKLGVMNGDEGMIVTVEANFIGVMFDRLKAAWLAEKAEDPTIEDVKPINFYLTPENGEYVPTAKGIVDDVEEENVEEQEEMHPLTNLLDLGYAMTVDASQGSEYENVIVHIPNHGANRFFMTRNRVYTAITRGKTLVIGTGDTAFFDQCKNIISPARTDHLAQWLNL
jgi:ATP-dependent exoDNAse (exonuclease V) alpha subunit